MANWRVRPYIGTMFCPMNRAKPTESDRLSLWVSKQATGWCLAGDVSVPHHFKTQAEAIAGARDLLSRAGGQLIVHAPNGGVRHMTIIGASAARRMNAIEGVALDSASRKLLREVERMKLTPAQRRSEVIKHFKGVKQAAG